MLHVSDYRQMATECADLASRMSLQDNRECLLEFAKRWRWLADLAEVGDLEQNRSPADASRKSRLD